MAPRAAAALALVLLAVPALLPAGAMPGALPGALPGAGTTGAGSEARPLLWVPGGAEPGADGNPAFWAADPSVVVVPYRLGLDFPVAMQFMDDGRLYYGEWQTGKVNLIATPGGPIQTILDLDVLSNAGEMGLHEINIHPVDGKDYLYVSYVYGSDTYWGCILCRDHLSRFEMLGPATLGPEQVLLDLQGGYVHNGGIIGWGPLDGKLYYSRGDTSYAAESQVVNGWTGRMLRLNPDGTIPQDNPMGPANPTFAYGLRHTFGFDFAPGSQLIVGTENSDNVLDEVNLILPGQNYGWPIRVGYQQGLTEKFMPPLRAFQATIGPTNGVFYTGTQVPQWTGEFFYGDTNNGIIRRLAPLGPSYTGGGLRAAEVVVDAPNLVVDLANGPDGYLYFSRAEGIYRVESAADLALPGARLPAVPALPVAVPALPLPQV